MTRRITTTRKPYARALGTGLLALDIIIRVDSHESYGCYAGGTCGNVLTILSYLGWHSAPLGRLSPGAAADRVLADLREWEVSTEFISLQNDGSTPIVIQRIARTSAGMPYHTFSWRCPGCGTHLPGYRPVLATTAQELAGCLPLAQVFFFDRVSRGALRLAEASSAAGAIVVFEPSGVGDPNLFREAWSVAHIIKYSHERLRDIADLDLKRSERESVLLEIETLGTDGLRYRSQLPKCPTRGWRQLDALKPEALKDAAGSGDWCTAGLLHRLARGGPRGLRTSTMEKLEIALRYGQALAAWNCGFEGARGGMYEVDKATFVQQIQKILQGSEPGTIPSGKGFTAAAQALGCFCPSCKGAEFSSAAVIQSGSRAQA